MSQEFDDLIRDTFPHLLAEIERLTAILTLHMPTGVIVDIDKEKTVPLTLEDTDRSPHTASAGYTNADGSPYTGSTEGFTLVWSSTDLNVATIDPSSGAWTLVGADGTSAITANVTLPNGVVISGSDTVTATPPAAPFPTGVVVTLA